MKVFYLVGLLLIFSCGTGKGTRKLYKTEHIGPKGDNNIFEVDVKWVKEKGKKFDLRIVLDNKSDTGLIIMLHDLRCYKGNMKGKIAHTFFNTGERTIDLKAGEVKQFNAVCKLGVKKEGVYKLLVRRVYENPSEDGKTKGKVLLKNLVWEYSN